MIGQLGGSRDAQFTYFFEGLALRGIELAQDLVTDWFALRVKPAAPKSIVSCLQKKLKLFKNG